MEEGCWLVRESDSVLFEVQEGWHWDDKTEEFIYPIKKYFGEEKDILFKSQGGWYTGSNGTYLSLD